MLISAISFPREVTAAWRRRGGRLLIEEDAVDAVADAERVLERLDMDVRGLGVDGVLDEEVHEPDDRRLECHVTQLVDVLVPLGAPVVLHALDDALQRRRRAAA